ncbi:transposase [Actinomyces bowdenii]|uniref:transposase n=1 Tax=Actinomyces bowdenii TaxID=131109 RepID=UPI001ABC128A|nr:transposase [Actinomyces bowdenii]MBO3724920.1 transposase [Actinomyces bowdenii]
MSRAKYSDEFKQQVVREVIDKEQSIASVAASYDLVSQTVGNWVAKYKKEHGSAEERQAAAEAAEVARLKKELRELQQGCEFLKKGVPRRWGAAWVCR